MKLNFNKNNYLLWIFISLCLKGLFFWIQVYINYPQNQPLLGVFTHDSGEYYNSAENFYVNGIYTPDNRMPGLGIIFLVLRLFFEKNLVLNIILVLQWVLSSIATYIIALTFSRILKKETVFYFVFFLIALTHFIFLWSTFLLTESPCISFFILSFYYLHRYYETKVTKYLFWCGIFLTWCTFLRPVFLLFYVIVALFLIWYFLREKIKFKTIFFNFILFFSVFIICDSAWTIRNYIKKDKFIFLNDIESYSVVNEKMPHPALYLFLESWGGDLENEMHWFEIDHNIDYYNRDTVLPSHMYTSQFNRDSLLLVKERFKLYKDTHADSLVSLLNNSLQNYTQSVRNERPYLYYIGSGIIYLKKLLFSGYGSLNSAKIRYEDLSTLKKTYRICLNVLFYIILFTGISYSVWFLIFRNKNFFISLFILIAFVNIIYIAFFFRTPEFRYMLPSTLIFMCFTGIVMANVWEAVKRKTISAK